MQDINVVDKSVMKWVLEVTSQEGYTKPSNFINAYNEMIR